MLVLVSAPKASGLGDLLRPRLLFFVGVAASGSPLALHEAVHPHPDALRIAEHAGDELPDEGLDLLAA